MGRTAGPIVASPVCPDCGDEIPYRSCQQPNTDLIAELALWVHRKQVHGAEGRLDPDLLGGAFAQVMDVREATDG